MEDTKSALWKLQNDEKYAQETIEKVYNYLVEDNSKMKNDKNIKVKLDTKLIPDEELKGKIKNFTLALEELPHNPTLNFAIYIDGSGNDDNPLKINLSDLLVEQVKKYFNKNN